MKNTGKLNLNREINMSYWKEDPEGFLTNILFMIAIGIPGIELIATVSGYTHVFMEPLLRTIGVLGFVILMALFFINKNHRFVLSDLFLALSVVFSIISIVFSQKIYVSLTGAYENWAEDPLQVVGYFVIFFMATQVSKSENRCKILVGVLVAALLHTIPAILQHLEVWPYEAMGQPDFPAATGLTQSHNFYGALAVIFSALTTMIFLLKKTKKYQVWYVASVVCFTAAMFSWSRLTWVGMAGYVMFVICFEIFMNRKKQESLISLKRFGVILVSFALICVLLMIFDEVITNQIAETAKEFEAGDTSEMGTGRMNIWAVGLAAVKDYLWTGIGFDNYEYSYTLCPEYINGWFAFKGHNEWIHILVTQGLPSVINYLAFCVFVILFGMKSYMEETDSKQKAIIYILLVMIAGYYCQALFNSSITNVAPYKWLIMGLLLPRCKQKDLSLKRKMRTENEK